MERAENIPQHYLHHYCLKGVGSQTGRFTISNELLDKVQIKSANLTQDLPELGLFDVIFLRNVMIYFSQDVKRQVLKHLMKRLRPDGYLVIGHSETLNGLETGMRAVVPSIYQMP